MEPDVPHRKSRGSLWLVGLKLYRKQAKEGALGCKKEGLQRVGGGSVLGSKKAGGDEPRWKDW